MRILYSHYLTNDHHPAAQMVGSIAEELRRLGHSVLVHRSNGPDLAAPPRLAGRERPRAEARLRGMAWFLKALASNLSMTRGDVAAIRRFAPDVVLARQDAYRVSMPLAASRLAVPLVTYADSPVAHETRCFRHDMDRWHPPGLVEAIERWTLHRSRAVVTISRPAARRLGRYGLRTPIHVVPNGVDPARFPRLTPVERERSRRELGLTAPRVVGFAGSFKAFHGIDRLREMILATSDRADTQWLLIGDGPERGGLEADLAGRAGVVSLGRRKGDEMGRLLGLMDVAVAPHARFAGDFYFCPLKVLEYAAAGCAVVASDQGDIPELLDHGRAGVMVSGDATDSWARAVRDLLDDDERRRSLGAAARARALSRYTWAKTAGRLADILGEAVREGASVPASTREESREPRIETVPA